MRISRLVFFLALWLVPGAVFAQSVGDPAPEFSYTTLSGDELSLSDYSGKVVFLFLLGNQCPFCLSVGHRTETEVNDVYSSSGAFQAIGLDLWDNSSSVSTVTAFKNHTGITYPICLKAGSMAGLYNTTYDRLIVIDGDGVIRFKGASNVSSTLDDARAVIDHLIMAATAAEEPEAPFRFALHQNYPNPFNPSTSISYSLPSPAQVTLRVLDPLGRHVRTLVERVASEGAHSVEWDGRDAAGRDLPTGAYVYVMEAGRYTTSRVMVLMR